MPMSRTRLRAPLLLLAAALALPGAARADSESRRSPVVRAVERVAPATVNITSTQEVRRTNPFFRGDPFFEEFFRQFADPRPSRVQSLGTGVLIDPEGLILTNQHVLAGATEIRVTLADGRELDGEVIGADAETDLAVLRVKADAPLPVAPLGSSDDVLIGETVIAIGNPFGLSQTVTTGVLSAVNRTIRAEDREYHGFLQTDASINPGNSGGPLLNIDGEVIGINTAIFRGAEGIGFAIPIRRALRIVDDLVRHGEVIPVWIGVRLQELTPALREAFRTRAPAGVLVTHVFAGSPAAREGLRRGDVLTAIDGAPIPTPQSFYQVLRGLTQGDPARLSIERDGEPRTLTTRPEAFPIERADELAQILLGIEVEPMTAREARALGLAAPRGMVIRNVVPQGAADSLGVRPGDVLLRVDQEPVNDLAGFRRAMTRLRGRDRTLLLVQRGRNGYYLPLELS
jgi:serine protease Do